MKVMNLQYNHIILHDMDR
jgi:hypothetical protein